VPVKSNAGFPIYLSTEPAGTARHPERPEPFLRNHHVFDFESSLPVSLAASPAALTSAIAFFTATTPCAAASLTASLILSVLIFASSVLIPVTSFAAAAATYYCITECTSAPYHLGHKMLLILNKIFERLLIV
jgi:hypothetical protein